MLEEEMMRVGFEYLLQQSDYKLVQQEIPFLSRCIDVVLVTDEDEIISVEFKVNKWRHAIEQAQNHKLGADKAYICLPKRSVTKALRTAVEQAGIGLYLLDPDAEKVIYEAIPAPQVKYNIPVFRSMLLDNLRKLG